MEKEGLIRSLHNIQEVMGLQVATLVTDRHLGIAKYMRTEQPHIMHKYDIWHVEKCEWTTETCMLTINN